MDSKSQICAYVEFIFCYISCCWNWQCYNHLTILQWLGKGMPPSPVSIWTFAVLPTNGNKRASGGHRPVGKASGGVKSSAAQTGDVLRMQRFTVSLWFTSRTVLGWRGLKGETPGEKIYTTEFLLSPSHFLPLSHPSWPKSPPSLVSKSTNRPCLSFHWCSTLQLQHSHYCQKVQSLALCRDFISVVWVTPCSVLRFRLTIVAQLDPWRNIPKKEVN